MLSERRTATVRDGQKKLDYTREKVLYPYERIPEKVVKNVWFIKEDIPVEEPEEEPIEPVEPTEPETQEPVEPTEPTEPETEEPQEETPHSFIAIKCIANDFKKLNLFYVPKFQRAVNNLLELSNSPYRVEVKCQPDFVYRARIMKIVDPQDREEFDSNKISMLELLEKYQNDSYTAKAYSPIEEAHLHPSVVDRFEAPYGSYLAFLADTGKFMALRKDIIDSGVFILEDA